MDKQIDGWRNRQIDGQIDRQMDKQIDRNRWINRQITFLCFIFPNFLVLKTSNLIFGDRLKLKQIDSNKGMYTKIDRQKIKQIDR